MRRPKAGVWRNSRASRPPEGMCSLAWKAGRLTEWCMWARFWIGAEPHGGGVLGQERAFEEPLKRQDEMVARAETGQPAMEKLCQAGAGGAGRRCKHKIYRAGFLSRMRIVP